MRQLATIRIIDSIRPIEGADAIECATIGGWTVVIQKDTFKAGDRAVYCEIDSWLPHELAPFLSKGHEPREYNGVKGERLRTVKLRGQLSQGLLLDLDTTISETNSFSEGDDVSEYLGIQKWEPPIPAELAGEVEGLFPHWIPKTDQERIQNLKTELEEWKHQNLTWEVTEKLDGASMTVFLNQEEFGVCSRNWQLRETQGNTLWSVARKCNLEQILRDNGGNYALQGELIGEGIQRNMYSAKGHHFYIFDIYDIDASRYLTPSERNQFVEGWKLNHVPVFHKNYAITETIEQLLLKADGKTVMGVMPCPWQEGLVFKCNEKESSFKCISNKFLIGEK